MSERILLTGGRAPATLELARLFSNQGHMVFVAESMRFPITRLSNSVTRHFIVPSARFETSRYLQRVEEIITQENISIFVPTCEEVLYASKVTVGPRCLTWVDNFQKLNQLHNKWSFIQLASKLGFAVPNTESIESSEQLALALAKKNSIVILKPVYSRFATDTVIFKSGEVIPKHVLPTDKSPWVLQEYIDGDHYCTYGLVRNGELLAHSAYKPQERWGMGSSTVFENFEDKEIEIWVRNFVEGINFTGQIAFDFIRSKEGILYPIECNPRVTSGVHLFQDSKELVELFCGKALYLTLPSMPFIRSIKLVLYVRLFCLLCNPASTERNKTWHFIKNSQDVVFSRKDPLPALGQFLSLGEFMLRSVRYRISATDATSYDISYNGSDDEL